MGRKEIQLSERSKKTFRQLFDGAPLLPLWVKIQFAVSGTMMQTIMIMSDI